MTNDLKNFLEEQVRKFCSEADDSMFPVELDKSYTEVANFVLEQVENELEEYKNRIGMPSGFGENAVRADASRDTLDDISTIINSLKV